MQLDADRAGDVSSFEIDFGDGREGLRDGIESGGDVVMVGKESGRWRRLGAERRTGEEQRG
jgi:hypothetical protein